MLDIFKALARVFKRRIVQTDSLVFRLHYSVTVSFLLLFCLIVTFNQYYRKPMTCREEGIEDHNDIVTEMCLKQFTYIRQKPPEPELVQPGVFFKKVEEKTINLKYYQWIFIYLFFQAVLFYVPRFLWKNWEGGKLRMLKNYLNVGLMSEDEKKDMKKRLVLYLHDYRNSHIWWTCQYLLCEILALINVIGQMIFMNTLFDGKFWSLGQNVLSHTASNETDPVTELFPRKGQCVYHMYGSSGTVQRHSSICVFFLNILYAKIFVFLWFWFVMLLIVTSAWIIFRIAMVTIPWIRKFVLYIRYGCHVNKKIVNKIVECSSVCDWFFLNMMGQNVDTLLFSDVLRDLAEQEERSKYNVLELSTTYP